MLSFINIISQTSLLLAKIVSGITVESLMKIWAVLYADTAAQNGVDTLRIDVWKVQVFVVLDWFVDAAEPILVIDRSHNFSHIASL